MGKIIAGTKEDLYHYLETQCRDFLPAICKRAMYYLEDVDDNLGIGASMTEALAEEISQRWIGEDVDVCEDCGIYELDENLQVASRDDGTNAETKVCSICLEDRNKNMNTRRRL